MNKADWMEEFPGAITITDVDGKIIFLNCQAALAFEAEGGRSLLGQNIRDCHRPESREKIRQILETGRPNIYTIEKQGRKKIIYQAAWTSGGEVRGLVELSLEIPVEMPHFIRD
ncbi:MAG: hypothetical protein NUW07_06015 [Candidatus Saccharicenans sp.]|jgi:transcriptional regulator with PAS, ATPase and Fis domain|nr:hypothetical protein [Candidatus Saccharicenans sp.]MDH7492334.1 hypothetical protein [Candidatus Saccharicenans sp.]